MADYWNHNVYYQPLILGAVPPGCGSALDVGCGDGLLACRLAERCRDVTGVDRDHAMIALARDRARDVGNVAFIDAEFPAFPLNLGLGLAHAALRAAHRERHSPRYPIKESTMTWDEIRIGALRLLPGVRYRRPLLWRYSLMWRKPA